MTAGRSETAPLSLKQDVGAGGLSAVAVLFAGSAALSIAAQGFYFPLSNNTFHVPIVLDYYGSSEGPHDVFHLALRNYVSWFWILLSTFVTERTIYGAFLTIHVIARFVILALLFEIVRTITPRADRKLAALAVAAIPFFMFTNAFSPVGRHEVFPNYLTQSHVVTIFVLVSWLLALRQKWYWAAAALGLGLNVSTFVCIWSAAALGGARLWACRGSSAARLARDGLSMFAAFVLFALPSLIWIGSTVFDSSNQQTAYDFRDFLLEYFPLHNFIHVQPAQAAKLVLIATIVAIHLRVVSPITSYRAQGVLFGLFAGLCTVFAIGAALPYVTGERLLLLLYPLRSDGFLVFLLLLLVVVRLALTSGGRTTSVSPYPVLSFFALVHGNLPLLLATATWDALHERKMGNAGRVAAAAGCGLPILYAALSGQVLVHPITLPEDAIAAEDLSLHWIVTMAAVAAVPTLLRHERQRAAVGALTCLHMIVGFAAAAHLIETVWPLACLYGATALLFMRDEWPRFVDYACAAMAAGIALFLTATHTNELRPVLITAAVMGALGLAAERWDITTAAIRWPSALAALLLITFGLSGFSNFISSRSLSSLSEHQTSWFAAQRWARANTPRDAMFLTPPRQNAFATLSRRPVWVDWKSGAASMWWPDYYPVWSRRLKQVRSLETLKEWAGYAQTNDIDFIVFAVDTLDEAEVELTPFIYRNRHYGIAEAAAVSSGEKTLP